MQTSYGQTLLQQHVEIQGGAAHEIQCMRLQKDLRGSSPLIVQQRKEFPLLVSVRRPAPGLSVVGRRR
jgi:hypothetical protein